jgi:hypothetical protein
MLLNIILLNVILLNVMAPFWFPKRKVLSLTDRTEDDITFDGCNLARSFHDKNIYKEQNATAYLILR